MRPPKTLDQPPTQQQLPKTPLGLLLHWFPDGRILQTDASTIAKTRGITVLSRVKALQVMYPQVSETLKVYTFSQKILDFFVLTWRVWVHFDTISRKN